MIEVSVESGVVFARWLRAYDGGSPQSFEIWGRLASEDDFSWKKIDGIQSNIKEKTEFKQFQLSSLFKNVPQNTKVTYFFSVRATNVRGGSGFNKVGKVVILPSEKDVMVPGTLNDFIVGELLFLVFPSSVITKFRLALRNILLLQFLSEFSSHAL